MRRDSLSKHTGRSLSNSVQVVIRTMRKPMLIIVAAAITCNLIAFLFFVNMDRSLPQHQMPNLLKGPAVDYAMKSVSRDISQVISQEQIPDKLLTGSIKTGAIGSVIGKNKVLLETDNRDIVKPPAQSIDSTTSQVISDTTIDSVKQEPEEIPPHDQQQLQQSQQPETQQQQQQQAQQQKQELQPPVTDSSSNQQSSSTSPSQDKTTDSQQQTGTGGTSKPDPAKADNPHVISEEDVMANNLAEATNKWREHLQKISAGPNNLGGNAAIQVQAQHMGAVFNPQTPARPLPDPEVAAKQNDWPIWWFAPFFDRTSFGKEAATLVLGMMRSGAVPEDNIWVGTTQGDCKYPVDTSMPELDFKQLDDANKRWNMSMSAIAVCHSLPPFWARPKNKWDTCFPCPPIGYTPAVTVGRAMAETDIYHREFVKYCNRMDEVWVPSDFSRDVLIRSGVEADKIRIVPIAVNTTWFDPERVKATSMPLGDLVFGKHQRTMPPPPAPPPSQPPPVTVVTEANGQTNPDQQQAQQTTSSSQVSTVTTSDSRRRLLGAPSGDGKPQESPRRLLDSAGGSRHIKITTQDSNRKQPRDVGKAPGEAGTEGAGKQPHWGWSANQIAQVLGPKKQKSKKPFVLLSCFKWEMRKGWDVLLASYLQEFTSEDHVELYILTKPFLTGSNFIGDMQDWVKKNLNLTAEQQANLPTLYVISHHLTSEEYAGLYKAADAFVIATRGEGWGMPISEAMSMGIPVVVTNWSGVTGFVDESVGYMVDYTLSKVPDDQPWWFRGARWAVASVDSMRQRLREVVSDRKGAARKGRRARERMVAKYSPEALGFALAKEFNRLKDSLRAGTCGNKCNNSTWTAPPGDTRKELYTGREEFIRGASNKNLDVVMEDTFSFTTIGGLNLNAMAALADQAGLQRAEAWKKLIAKANSRSPTTPQAQESQSQAPPQENHDKPPNDAKDGADKSTASPPDSQTVKPPQ